MVNCKVKLITNILFVVSHLQVLRCFHLTETVFSKMALATNTSAVTLTTKETVDSLLEVSLGSAVLPGVAGKIWRMFSSKT